MKDKIELGGEYLAELYRGIVLHPESLSVAGVVRGGVVVYEVRVCERDKGICIGRGGKMIEAVRVVMRGYAGRWFEGMLVEVEVKEVSGQ